ncbi:hypothetical protein [Mycobacterium sp.]|uniref:hypothetical protein n=1 Tax=Mycobacterium sp. TaxID=1785 RepID=UPI003BAF496D
MAGPSRRDGHDRRGGYRAKVHGSNSVHADFWFDTGDNAVRWDPGNSLAGAVVATGMRVANAIPLVCDAPPGYYTPMTLNPSRFEPLTVGRRLQPSS